MSWDIIGIGAISSVGRTARETFDALCAGHDGRAPLRVFDTGRYRAGHAYEIDDRTPGGRDTPLRATGWLLTATAQALADAGLGEDLAEVPVLVGTTLREQRSVELWWREGTPLHTGDLHFGAALRRRFGATTTYTFANSCAASLYALGMAADLLELGLAETVVVAGTDAITESTFGAMDRVQTLVPDAARPFDRTHKGMVMGEGAVAVVLRRSGGGGRPAARLRSVGLNCDAGHPTAPDPTGIATVVRDSHRRAGVRPVDIDLVMLHGTGTARNDETEAAVMSEIFGRNTGPLMAAIKSGVGHTLGGSGLLSLVMAVLSTRHGRVPPVIGLSDPIEPAAGLRLVQGSAATADIGTAQVNAFGFGGINAVAVVEKA